MSKIREPVLKRVDDPYVGLANAIIMQAVNDFREAWADYRTFPNNKDARESVDELESFFESEWFRTLSLGADGKKILSKLEEERNDTYFKGNLRDGGERLWKDRCDENAEP